MPTVPQPYTYPIANIPGGFFDGQSSDHLIGIIAIDLPTGVNPVVESDGINVTVSFDVDLTTEEKAILDTLVARCNDFFIVTLDNGITDEGEPATIEKAAGLLSSSTITLKYKSGDGTDSNGFGETVVLRSPIMQIDRLGGDFDGTGKFQFVIGALLERGEATILIECDGLPSRTVIARWI